MKDEQAVARLKQGDLSALEDLVTHYYLPALRTAYLVLQDKGQAEEVVQTVFLGLKDTIRRFDPQRPFGPWFLRCVVNAALNHTRREARFLSLDSAGEDADFSAQHWLYDQCPGPVELVEENERKQAVSQALTQLTPQQRAVVVLRYYLEMDENEMAQTMRQPKSSLKWWLHTAKIRLRGLLSALDPVQRPVEAGKEKRR
jgi:RNA polymerase sigma-70 factor (ECF subfamily)